jgi:hypothetical protein
MWALPKVCCLALQVRSLREARSCRKRAARPFEPLYRLKYSALFCVTVGSKSFPFMWSNDNLQPQMPLPNGINSLTPVPEGRGNT